VLRTAARKTGKARLATGTIALAEDVLIPPGITDLEAFRRWARSDAFPEHGRFSWIAGQLRVDVEMEQIYIHNQLKQEFNLVLGGLVKTEHLGYYLPDGARFSHPAADLSVEPDAFFISYESVRSGCIKEISAASGAGPIEFEGTPDMVLEIVSPSSVKQDTEDLRELYWKAGIAEYWLVDARGQALRFELLHRGKKGNVASRAGAKGLRSKVFGRFFRLTRTSDPLGKPMFAIRVVE
jgi:Uma2 family endonuclease